MRAHELAAEMAARVARATGIEAAVDVDAPFADLGLASRDLMELRGELSELREVDTPATVVWGHRSIAALSRALGEGAVEERVEGGSPDVPDGLRERRGRPRRGRLRRRALEDAGECARLERGIGGCEGAAIGSEETAGRIEDIIADPLTPIWAGSATGVKTNRRRAVRLLETDVVATPMPYEGDTS
ncbi:acyl carrier protein [Clavibacter sp. CFBP 8614]|uniref:acyl carrier protein n=1 Tax=unclassified Clavibacter TaxID=2626594 RepID=UPI0040424EEE